MVRATEAVIHQLVREKRELVMVGRGAQACLAERSDALHVFLVAPKADRVRAATERLGVSADEAEAKLDATDDGRRRYVKAHYHRQWEDPLNYHLVLNTGIFDYEQCAAFVVQAAKMRGWRRHS